MLHAVVAHSRWHYCKCERASYPANKRKTEAKWKGVLQPNAKAGPAQAEPPVRRGSDNKADAGNCRSNLCTHPDSAPRLCRRGDRSKPVSNRDPRNRSWNDAEGMRPHEQYGDGKNDKGTNDCEPSSKGDIRAWATHCFSFLGRSPEVSCKSPVVADCDSSRSPLASSICATAERLLSRRDAVPPAAVCP